MRIISFLLLFVLLSCSKNQTEENSVIDYIKPGCIPTYLIEKGPALEGFEESYIYSEDKLTKFGFYTYEYAEDKVNRIYRNDDNYEEYFYDESNNIIESKEYNGIPLELVVHYTFEYEGDKIRKSTNMLNSEEQLFIRQSGTTNIDSILTYDENGAISRVEVYAYDDKPNVFSNVCTPKFGFHRWIIKSTKNNIIRYDKYRPDDPNGDPVFYYVELEYNEFDFPSKTTTFFSPGYNKVREYEYDKCN